MRPRYIFAIIALLFVSLALPAQQQVVTGQILDDDNEALVSVNVVLSNRDSLFLGGTVTNTQGRFSLPIPSTGEYILAFSFIGYDSESHSFKITGKSDHNIGVINLSPDVEILDEVDIIELNQAVKLEGDTTVFSANSYRVATNSTAEDLISKMPGMTIEDGVVKAHGEEVEKVLVDGKEFFGDDASIAFKNIPADIIETVQVYDKSSDMSEFTGFRDSETTKTVNIRTYENLNKGWFGRLNAAYGYPDLYSVGGNLNYFNGDTRLSIVGLSNNVNQQNFSQQDMIGIMSSSAGRGGPPQGGGNSNVPAPPQRDDDGGSSMSNYFVGQNGGLNTVNSLGFNYVDSWSSKIDVTGSYFYNNSINYTTSTTDRDYLFSSDNIGSYNESQLYESRNDNHRFNFKFDYKINDKNRLMIRPGLSMQSFNSSSLSESNLFYNSATSNTNKSDIDNDYTALNFSNSILFRHKFNKTGRTISFNLKNNYNSNEGLTFLNSDTYYSTLIDTVFVNQKTESISTSNSVSADVSYTEPVGDNSQLMLSIKPSLSDSYSDKLVYSGDDGIDNWVPDSILSNYYSFKTYDYKAGVSYRYYKNKLNFNMGLDFQNLSLIDNLSETNNSPLRTYNSILPKIDFHYHLDKGKFLHLNLTSRTSVPTISQLQNVVDNSNTSILVVGNPLLDQQRTNSAHLAFRTIDKSYTKSMFFVLSAQMSDSYIATTNYTAFSDTVMSGGIVLQPGTQLNSYENLEGYYKLSSFMTFSLPAKIIRSTVSYNMGSSWSKMPGLINDVYSSTNSNYLFGGLTVNSNISENVDFRVGYSAGYYILNSELQATSDYDYYVGKLSGKAKITIFSDFMISSDISYNHYYGEMGIEDNNNLIWNGGLGYMFLKDNAAELKVSVYDILNQNNAYSQNITTAYVERVYSNVMQRYVMLGFTYNLKNFDIENNMPERKGPPPTF